MRLSPLPALLDRVKAMPLEEAQRWAAAYLETQEQKREGDRRYAKTDKSKARHRRYYFTRNDIYHPQLNPRGTHEKRWKRAN
jgi:hypothetical protein